MEQVAKFNISNITAKKQTLNYLGTIWKFFLGVGQLRSILQFTEPGEPPISIKGLQTYKVVESI